MKKITPAKRYLPSTYTQRRTTVEERIGTYVREWEKQRSEQKRLQAAAGSAPVFFPSIALSRKIGVGALEIADIVAGELGFSVADRELIEKIAEQADISKKAISFFDERFPGYYNRTVKYLFGEKSFIDSDYARHLISAVTAVASLGSTVFVGRGAHLILPRDRVLAVRCICSNDFRIQRISNIMGIDRSEAKQQLSGIDREQAAFFKKVFNRKAAQPDEFDMVVNLDHFAKPKDVADLVQLAFAKKFNAPA